MFKTSFNYISVFISSLFFVGLGLGFCFYPSKTVSRVYVALICGILIIGILRVLNVIWNYRKVKNKMRQLMEMILWIIIIIVGLFVPNSFVFILPRLLGVWTLLYAFVKLVVLYIKIVDHLPLRFFSLIEFIFYVVVTYFLLFQPTQHYVFISNIIGIYFIVMGLDGFHDFLVEIVPEGFSRRLGHKIQVLLPPLVSALIPPQILSIFLDKNKEEQIKEEFDAIKKDLPLDMEVLIHLAPSGPSMLGHVDIVYQGYVISYGAYDSHTRKLIGTMGDGVILVAPKETYIHNCLVNENKTLISFGIVLDKQQRKNLEQTLKRVFENCYDFYSDEQLKQMGKEYVGDCKDYISRVTRTSPLATFHKVSSGKFKTFFVLSTSCVMFASEVLRSVDLHVLDLTGIISPGAYYDFLNRKFRSHSSFVVSRTLYRKQDAKLFEKN